MRKGTVAATEMTTGWGLRTFTTDALSHMDILTAPVTARDKPDKSADLHMLEAALSNCSKHYASDSEDGARTKLLIEMAMISAGAAELTNFYGIPSDFAGG